MTTTWKTVVKILELVWIKCEPMSVAARLGLSGDIVKNRLPSVRMEGLTRTTSLISLVNGGHNYTRNVENVENNLFRNSGPCRDNINKYTLLVPSRVYWQAL